MVGLSEDQTTKENDETKRFVDLSLLAKLIPRICHNINRVCYIFGDSVKFPLQDITQTFLTPHVLSTLREVDSIATNILMSGGFGATVSQMPVILIPIHFDRDVVSRQQSCQRSVVIRTFITEDFMTGIVIIFASIVIIINTILHLKGVPAIPNRHIPLEVSLKFISLFN